MKKLKTIFAILGAIVMLTAITCNCVKGQGRNNKSQKNFFKTCKSKGYKASKSKSIWHKGSKGKVAKTSKKDAKKGNFSMVVPTMETTKEMPTTTGFSYSIY